MASIEGDTSDRPQGRDVALRRGTAASALLRRAAQLAREDTLPVSTLPAILRPRGTIADGSGGWYSIALRVSFVVVFLVPALLASIYYGFIASSQYSTEVRFAVRAGERSSLEQIASMGTLSNLATVSQAQDTLVITNYVQSRTLVEQLDAELNLRAMFSRDGIDFLSSVDPDAQIEKLVRYWSHHVKIAIENTSGLVTITVYAFTPEDALAITKAITKHSEDLINQMSARASGDLLKDTESELARAEERLKETRGKLQELRNSEGTLDPNASAEGVGELVKVLRQERIAAAGQLAAMSAGLSPDAPQLKPLKARIAALDAQIAQLEAEMTGGEDKNLSSAITSFEGLELDNQVAERRYAAAISALEAARLSAERRRTYVTTFVEPSLPEEPSAPSRGWYIVLSILAPFFAWATLAGTAGFVRAKLL